MLPSRAWVASRALLVSLRSCEVLDGEPVGFLRLDHVDQFHHDWVIRFGQCWVTRLFYPLAPLPVPTNEKTDQQEPEQE